MEKLDKKLPLKIPLTDAEKEVNISSEAFDAVEQKVRANRETMAGLREDIAGFKESLAQRQAKLDAGSSGMEQTLVKGQIEDFRAGIHETEVLLKNYGLKEAELIETGGDIVDKAVEADKDRRRKLN